jgi:AcrR family transcriptional regulator
MCSATATATATTTPRSSRDRIVQCALGIFGAHGIEATSLRTVAKTAGVSPALVVHHFGGKQGLVEAVDAAALREFAAAYRSHRPTGETDLLRRRAAQTARVMRERADVCAYLGRALVEGTPGSVRLFRMTIESGQAEIEALAAQGALRGDADRLWVTLQHFFLIWAPLSFRALLEQTVLDGSMLDRTNLERWVSANETLLREGIYR